MAALRAAVFLLSAKNRRGGHFLLPPSSARVKGTIPPCSKLFFIPKLHVVASFRSCKLRRRFLQSGPNLSDYSVILYSLDHGQRMVSKVGVAKT